MEGQESKATGVNEHDAGPDQQQEELRREIERTRAELGATVEALSHKADVKQQAREKVVHAKATAQSKAQDLQQRMPEQARERPVVPLAAGIGAALIALWLIRRR